jgi:hypothetical protein
MATETEPAQGYITAIGFTLVLPVIDARLHCLALPGAAFDMLDNAVLSWNRTGTLRLPMAWAFFLCNLTPPRSDALCKRAKQDPPGAASCPTAPMGTGPVRR